MPRNSRMGFSELEKQAMLNLKGVGPTVIQRLEEVGYGSLKELRDKNSRELANEVSEHLGSLCWRNSPLARTALERLVALAEEY